MVKGTHDLIADPLFKKASTNFPKADFSLRKESPYLKMDYKGFDYWLKNEKPSDKEAKVTAYPEPKPDSVLYTDKEIIIDGKLDEWKEIKSMPMPFMKTDKGPLKLLWNKKGLYGAVKFKDDSIKESKESPWEGDAMEFWLDTENTRAKSSDDVKHAFQIFILPDTEAGPGKCFIKINYNENEKEPIANRVDDS